jgi:ATP-binding cassette subfamily F protein uup
MRVLAGAIEPDDGKVKIKNGIKISYLEQSPPEDNNKNIFDIVAKGLGDIGIVLTKYQHLWCYGLGLLCLASFSTICQLYCGGQFY